MITENKHFYHVDRASYELGNLLRSLPRHIGATVELDDEQLLLVAAAGQHAENYSHTLLHGLEAIGHVMCCGGNADDRTLPPRQLLGLGELVKELAVQLQFLEDFRASVADRELQLAMKGNAK